MNWNHAKFTPFGIIAVAALAAFTFVGNSRASAQADDAASIAGPPVALPAMLPTSITAGLIDPAGKVPTVNGVPSSGVSNVDLSFPLAILTHGTVYVYSLTVQDNNYTGSCTASYSLSQVQSGKTVTLDFRKITTFNTAPGNIWLWVAQGKAIPNSPGLATLTGLIKCGTTSYSVKSTMLLQ